MPNQSETFIGIVLLVASIVMLVGCLLCVVKSLNAMLKGSLAKTIQKYVNQDLPGPFAYFTNWVALGVGAVITVLLQSSSFFTATLTPLVGIGMVSEQGTKGYAGCWQSVTELTVAVRAI